jgi:uncharacterized SAM-binding protein YcdF (DUF218 family)
MLHLLISPLTWAVALMGALRFTKPRSLRVALWAALLLSGALAAPVGSNALVWVIENRLQNGQPCGPDERAPVVLLTGGFDYPAADVDDFAALSSASLRRLTVALAVSRRQPEQVLVISGGRVASGPAEAEVAAALARRLGADAPHLLLEVRSTNTWENAREVARLLGPGRRIQLVTSALHAARAEVALRAHGLSSCLYRADSIFVPFAGLGYLIPQSSSLAKSERSLHELLGLVHYLTKRSDVVQAP